MCLFINKITAFLLLLAISSAGVAQPTLKIGVLGAMSGPAKYWGLTNKYCALTTAKMYNDQGGVKIGERKYLIQILSYDTELNDEKAVAGAKQLIRKDGIRYIIGPNIDDTSFAILPLLEANNVVNVSYGFNPKLFQPPRRNSILGMTHPFVSAPAIYQYLKEKHNVESVAFLARRDKEAINQRNIGIRAAEKTGLNIKEMDAWDINEVTYPENLEGLNELAASYARLQPDLMVLSGVAPLDTAKIISRLRDHRYQGFISTETAQDPRLLLEELPQLTRFISLASSPSDEIHTRYMQTFRAEYQKIAGQWHDEAGVKVYALETILRILQQAGPAAIENTELFLKAAASFSIEDPFYHRTQPLTLSDESGFGQKRQINVPLTLQIIENGNHRSVSF